MLAELASNPVFTRERPKLEGWVKGVIEEWEEERDKEEATWEETIKQEELGNDENEMQKVPENGKEANLCKNEDSMDGEKPADDREEKQRIKETLGVLIEEAEMEVSSTGKLVTGDEQEAAEGLVVEPGWRSRGGRQGGVSRGGGEGKTLEKRK